MFVRNCPDCQCEIVHKSEYHGKIAEKEKRFCRKCSFKGERNPFHGKKHSEKTKKAISKTRNEIDKSSYRSDEFRQKMSKMNSGSNNPMANKSVHSTWVTKYGKEEADKRLQVTKDKHSKNNSGSGNPMYGKPAPNGSGNGWKGWYKNIFFRSLRELMFMIELDKRNIPYQSFEKLRIKYVDYLGNDRTYSPDFLVGNKVIEIKPIKLHNSPNNLLKFKAAKEYCYKNNLDFWVIDVKINKDIILSHIDKIKFSSNYLEKFNLWTKN